MAEAPCVEGLVMNGTIPHELTREWLAYPSPGNGDVARLHNLGVTREAIHRSGGLAVVKAITAGAMWMPEVGGRPMLATAVFDGPAPSIYNAVEHPVLLDLIAWTPAQPDLLYWRTGYGTELGTEHIDASLSGAKIRLFPNVLEWLQADCQGAVLLELHSSTTVQVNPEIMGRAAA
jgi:hypothetical protein